MKRIFTTILSLALVSTVFITTADESFARSRRTTCRIYAERQARHVMDNHVGTGALVGAGVGGAYGGITGNGAPSNLVTGLLVGGLGGALIGGAIGNDHRQQVYRRAFEDCMNNY